MIAMAHKDGVWRNKPTACQREKENKTVSRETLSSSLAHKRRFTTIWGFDQG